METISYLVWHLFLPLGFRLSYHITLPLYVVSIDCGLKSSDRIREDSKVHVSKQRHGEAGREGKYGSQIVLWEIWQSDCALAPCYCVGTTSTA